MNIKGDKNKITFEFPMKTTWEELEKDLEYINDYNDEEKNHHIKKTLDKIKALLAQNYVKGYEDCLEEKYDKAKKHFDKKLAQTRKEVIEELVRKIRGMKKEYDDDVIQRSYDIEHNEALDKAIRKAKELK
uniref:Uncharacterized protein n=1 Tax=viral metagenome TaxID=1070528 RepID=A0A6H1ZFX0_9ZZZZ